MSSRNANLGTSIEKLLQNVPFAVAVNNTASFVSTNGGSLFQSGLINDKIQYSFHHVSDNRDIIDHIVDIRATDNALYVLSGNGYVFEYKYNGSNDCQALWREVYSPIVCAEEKAIMLRTGSAHALILTERHRVFGTGSNDQYQIVPQGACSYCCAVEMLVTDTNIHDNCNCCSFMGTLNELNKPCIPKKHNCGKVTCIKKSLKCIKLGDLVIEDVMYQRGTDTPLTGTLLVPVHGNLSYVGFLCVGDRCDIDGNLTYTVEDVFIKEGCFKSTFIPHGVTGEHAIRFKVASTEKICFGDESFTGVVQLERERDHEPCDESESSSEDESSSSEDECERPDECCGGRERCCPRKKIHPKREREEHKLRCGDIFHLDINDRRLRSVDVCTAGSGLELMQGEARFGCSSTTILTPLDSITLTVPCVCGVTGDCDGHFRLSHNIKLDCCVPCKTEEPKLPQPCWTSVYAGFNTSVLVDSCNRMYVFGDIHNVRNNADLLQRPCLEKLLCATNASIHLPADQLNCGTGANNCNSYCPKSKCKKPFVTDLSKFGINISFPTGTGEDEMNDCECCPKTRNVCEFLNALKKCNDAPFCDNTCVPCDSNIYLNVFESCERGGPAINSITVLNKNSVCKIVSQGHADTVKFCLTPDTVLEFDLNQYCIDSTMFPLSKVIVLETGAKRKVKDAADIVIYVDVCNPGAIKFVPPCKCPAVEFVVNASNEHQQFILNYGDVMDPAELTNLKSVMINRCTFPCPQFKNPFCSKLFNTYLRGGDCVNFFRKHHSGIKLAVTADVPTVFRLNRRVLDIGVGKENLSVLVGGLACPNEIYAIGQNCFGQLGLDSHRSVVCWKLVNRCLFDCQVQHIFSGATVNFYVTQSGRVFGSGLWKCLVNSTSPVCIPGICQSWKTKEIAVSKNQVIILGRDGGLYGVGDNSLGELGLCHINCVPNPVSIPFFSDMNYRVANQLFNYRGDGFGNRGGRGRNGGERRAICDDEPERPYCKPLYNDCSCKVDCDSCCKDGENREENNGRRGNANFRISAQRGGRF
jgi:hypothetical protein